MGSLQEKIEYPKKREIEDKEYCEKIVAKSIEKVEMGGLKIGSGKTAKVFSPIEGDPNICMKAVSEKIISSNDVGKEMYFLDYLSSKGFNVPKPVCAVQTNKKDYLFMETIGDGTSIEDIVADGTGEKIKSLPVGFNFDDFFKKLNKEVERMHEQEKIYHRDLHAGNIMIDKNGDPVIIDFGDAKEIYLSEEDPYRYTNPKGELSYHTKDEDNISDVRMMLGKYLKENNYNFDKK